MWLFTILVIWGALGGVLSAISGANFFRGFFIFTLPPLTIGLVAGVYFCGLDFIAKKFEIDLSEDANLIAIWLFFFFIIAPLAIFSLEPLFKLF